MLASYLVNNSYNELGDRIQLVQVKKILKKISFAH